MLPKYLWFVDWEDLEAVFTSMEKAEQYVKNEAERMEGTIKKTYRSKKSASYVFENSHGRKEGLLIYQIGLDPVNSMEA